MNQQMMCPICYVTSTQRIMRDVQFAACIDERSYSVSDFVAFMCPNGHVFLVMSHHADATRVDAESLMVM